MSFFLIKQTVNFDILKTNIATVCVFILWIYLMVFSVLLPPRSVFARGADTHVPEKEG